MLYNLWYLYLIGYIISVPLSIIMSFTLYKEKDNKYEYFSNLFFLFFISPFFSWIAVYKLSLVIKDDIKMKFDNYIKMQCLDIIKELKNNNKL